MRGGSRRGQINGSAIELISNSNSQSRVGHLVPEGVRHTTQRPGVRSPPRSQTWPPLTGQRHSFTLQTRPAKSHGVAHASRTIGCVTVPPSICLPCCSPPSALVAEPPKVWSMRARPVAAPRARSTPSRRRSTFPRRTTTTTLDRWRLPRSSSTAMADLGCYLHPGKSTTQDRTPEVYRPTDYLLSEKCLRLRPIQRATDGGGCRPGEPGHRTSGAQRSSSG